MNITHYMITESSTPPAEGGPNWIAVTTPSADLSITGGAFTISSGEGTKHVYAWVKDDAGNVSSVNTTSHFDVVYDTAIPLITSFVNNTGNPTTTNPISITITGTDAGGINGWTVTETPVKPAAGAAGWNSVSPAVTSLSVTGSYTFAASGTRALYAWVKDIAGKVSDLSSSSHFEVIFARNPWDDVLLRDYTADTGDVPTSGCLCLTPDLICNKNVLANPAADFPDYNTDYYKNPYVSHENYFYVRAKNMGTALGDEAAETYVYYTESSLLLTPSDWITRPMKVDIGGNLQNNNPLPALANGAWGFAKYPFRWTPDPLAAGQHYCIIGIASTPNHIWDTSNPPHIASWTDFILWVEYNPNVCWHNITLETLMGGGGGSDSDWKSKVERVDAFNNPWKDDLPVLIKATVREVPVGAKIIIKNSELGIDLAFEVRSRNCSFMAPGVLKGKVKSKVEVSVEIPRGTKFVHGSQLEVSSYIGSRSKLIKKLRLTADFRRILEHPALKKAVDITKKIGKGINKADTIDEANFVMIGNCTTLFYDEKLKKLPRPRFDLIFPEIDTGKKHPPVGKKPVKLKKAAGKKVASKEAVTKKTVKKSIVNKPVKKAVSKKIALKKSVKKSVKKSTVTKPVKKNVQLKAIKKTAAKKAVKKKKKQ